MLRPVDRWLIVAIVAGLIAIALALFLRRPDLNVDPHARREIEKARER
jgi:phosphate/sulfate permease